jgi:glycerol-3-phosphate dehydrogenase
MRLRAEALHNAANQSFDLCVIGGGATGAGCALDAQLRGLKTILVEGADFASGASSGSTKMVHGGVRYLERAVRRLDRAEYRVVKRALRERLHMLRNAPFLTRTRQFVTPCYSWREVAYYETGLKLYDWLAGRAGLASSRFLSREEALRRIAMLNPEGLVGAVAYTDGQFDDARYNIALIETFAAAGGEALNYARVVKFEKDGGGKIRAAEVEDRVSGERLTVRAIAVVNATGPFADSVREMATPGAPRRMHPSRGVHVLLPLELLSGRIEGAEERRSSNSTEGLPSANWEDSAALLIPKTEDGRVLFGIPWMGRLLVGTTDEPVGEAGAAGVSSAEAEYLLRHLNRYLVKPIKPEQIVSAFAGVRPLVSSGDERGGETKELARDHVVEVDAASGLINILGGKWTTYRAMAEDAIDAVERQLSGRTSGCGTSAYPLVGSGGFTARLWRELMTGCALSERSARHLSEKFGSRAAQVMALARENPSLAAPLARGLAPLKVEVVFCARYEMATSIEDVLARRIGLESFGWQEALTGAPAAAELLGSELGWTAEATQRALQEYVLRIERERREVTRGN